MAEPFLGEIRIFPFNFAPRGWAFCNGQLLPISQNTALFSLVGTTYGGDGRTSFGLPNLQARAPLHPGQGPGLTSRRVGETGGLAEVTLTVDQLPAHHHEVLGANVAGQQTEPANRVLAAASGGRALLAMYASSAGDSPALHPEALSNTGGDQPHNNLPPYLTLNFCIALVGVYPSRS
jgi:microcystin-dependent protein